MIISISGKIGSGKDTVGSIIQYLTCGADKANISYVSWDGNTVWNIKAHDWRIKKFADKLKEITCMLIGCTREQLEDQEFKKTVLGPEWNNMPVREFLQKLETEAMRNGLHENVWVNSLMADYRPDRYTRVSVTYIASNLPNWIITDTRYPNELEAVKAKEGVTIKVTRVYPGLRQEIEKGNIPHPSETALDDATFDYEIVNDGTIEDLIEKVRVILIELSII